MFYTKHLLSNYRTIYENIYLIRPGENLIFDINNFKILRKKIVDI